MPRSGGVYSLPEAAFVNGTTIDEVAVNSDFSDIGSEITNSIAADGQTTPTANLPMGNLKHTGVADGSARTHYASLGQVAKGTLFYAADAGAADAYAVAPSPGIAANVVGFMVRFKVTNANLTTTPTLAVNSLTAGTIVWPNGSALAAGDLPANAIVECEIASLSGATPTWHLQTVAVPPVNLSTTQTITGTKTFSGTVTFSGTTTLTKSLAGTTVRGYLDGLTLSNNAGTPNTKIDVAAGVAADSTNAVMLSSAGGTIDCGTTGANGLDAGSLANTTWYHAYAIGKTDGTMALLASTSASAPTMPSGYTLKRRLGSFRTDGSAHIIAFKQLGELFTWDVPVSDLDTTNPGTSAVTRTLTVPTGVVVQAWFSNSESNGSNNRNVLWTALDQTDTAPSNTLFSLRAQSTATVVETSDLYVKTNTSAQIRYRTDASGASDATTVATKGWVDQRGKDS